MTRINVAIAVAGEARARIYEVASLCRALGFGHALTRSDRGVLIGSAELDNLPMLRTVPGVLSVELDDTRPPRGTRRTPAVRIRRSATPRGRRPLDTRRDS